MLTLCFVCFITVPVCSYADYLGKDHRAVRSYEVTQCRVIGAERREYGARDFEDKCVLSTDWSPAHLETVPSLGNSLCAPCAAPGDPGNQHPNTGFALKC